MVEIFGACFVLGTAPLTVSVCAIPPLPLSQTLASTHFNFVIVTSMLSLSLSEYTYHTPNPLSFS